MSILFGFALAFSLALTVVRIAGFIAYSWWLIWAPVWGMAVVYVLFHLVCYYIAARQLAKEAKELPQYKSKWQQKLEEMKAMQNSKK